MSRRGIDEPTSSGVALQTSTGWYAVHDERGETVGGRLFSSSFRAAEWAMQKFGKPWPELHAIGFTVQGGAVADTEGGK
jgi:hypothetical protein